MFKITWDTRHIKLSISTNLLKKFFEMDIFQGIWKNMEVALKSLVYNYMNLKMELVRDWTLVDENSKSNSNSQKVKDLLLPNIIAMNVRIIMP